LVRKNVLVPEKGPQKMLDIFSLENRGKGTRKESSLPCLFCIKNADKFK